MTTPDPVNDAPSNPASGEFFDFAKPSNRRSFVLLALGALAGLGIAGYGLFTAKGTATNQLPAEDIALVNQRPIYRSDFVIQAQTLYSVPFDQTTQEQRQRVLDDMVDEELMVQRGLEVDLPSYDPDVRTALVNGVELQLYADVLAKEPSDDELKTYYQQHREKYASVGVMRLRDLALNTVANESADNTTQRAHQIVAELRRGTPLDDAFMKRYALRDSGRLMQSGKPDLGDIFDFAAEINLGPKLYAVAKRLQQGEISDPSDDNDGLHILVMTLRKAPQPQAFEAVRPQVWNDIKKDAQTKIHTATLKYLRSKASILTAPVQ